MGHELFLKIFDGPQNQNIFLCSPLVILIFKLKWSIISLFKVDKQREMSELAIKEIKGSLSLAIEDKTQLCDNFSSALFVSLTPFSQG